MKQIAILGSTGSIGRNTLRVVDALKGGFGVAALGAGANVELLAAQIEQYQPRLVSVSDEESAEKLLFELKRRGVESRPKIGVGAEGLCEVATCDGADCCRLIARWNLGVAWR
jgi:1-deoxy-D-xylulose-5-phosphate reductoisomerase